MPFGPPFRPEDQGEPRSASLRLMKRQVRRLRVVVLDEDAVVLHHLALDADARRDGPRVLEVLRHDVDVGAERGADLRLRDEVRIGRDGAEDPGQRAVAVEALPPAPVRGAGRGEREARDPRVVEARVRPHDGSPVLRRVPRDAHAGLPHALVRRDVPVRRELLSHRRLPDEACVEDVFRRGDRVRLDLRLPAEAELDREVRGRLPLVLDEDGRLVLADRLRPRLLRRQPADSRLLEEEEDRAGDRRPRRAGPALARRAVGALDVVAVPA
jgi:hypothetical protein